MQQFIKLTQPDGDKALIKTSEIDVIMQNKEKAETLVVTKNLRITVSESPEEIEKLIAELIAAASAYH